MSDNELKDILKQELEPKFQSYFTQGLMTGWDICIRQIDKQIASLTSAKAIKDLVKASVGEADKRIERAGGSVCTGRQE